MVGEPVEAERERTVGGAGLEFDAPGQAGVQVRARGGVILGAGDYAASPEFKGELISPLLAQTRPANPTATGKLLSVPVKTVKGKGA